MRYDRGFLRLLDIRTLYWRDSGGNFVGTIPINENIDNIYKKLERAILFGGLYSNRYQKGLFSIVHSVMANIGEAKPENWYCFYRENFTGSHIKFLIKTNNEFSFINSNDIKEVTGGRSCFFNLWEIIEHLDIDIEKSYTEGSTEY